MFSLPRLFLPLGFALIFGAMFPACGLDFSDLGAAEKELESLASDWQSAHDQAPTAETGENLALTLQTLGIVERQMGKPDAALEHLTRACDLLATHAPEQLPDALEAKALTLQDLGKLDESETLLRQVLEARRSTTGNPVDLDLVATLDHLALNLLYSGRYTEVGTLLDQAIAAAGTEAPDVLAQLLDHKGRLYHTLGSHSKAIDSFREALALPFDNAELRLTLESQLALAQLRLGRADDAKIGIEAVAEAAKQIFATDPLRAVPYINNQGELYLSLGDFAGARKAFSEALDLLDTNLEENHPSLMLPLNNLGVAEQEAGDFGAAKEHLERAAALQAEHLPPIHLRVAETERNLARNALLMDSPDALGYIEKATGVGLELLDQLIREGSEKERLNFLERFELLSLPCATGDAEMIADVLLASKARLLDALIGEGQDTGRIVWQDVQASLAQGSAFIDTCRYFSISTPATEQYGAVLILPEGPPQWIPLDPGVDLQGWMKAFRSRLNWRSATMSGEAGPPPPLKMRGILRALYRGYWEPIAERLPQDIQHIAYSPAGMLHFLPLSALLDSEDQALSRNYLQVATVSSGRDLLNSQASSALSEQAWAVLTVSHFPKSSGSDSDDDLLRLLSDLQPMPGTMDEASKLRRFAPKDSIFLSDQDATESALHTLPFDPAVLHLGSHAFFLEDPVASAGLPVDFDERSELLYSGGLVLYRGAERSIDSPKLSVTDDLLFPSEIAKLPLQGTRLVTLSSCESGAGTPVSGEGILGLRRAFALAGARETVVALWPVSDVSTPPFMEQFYARAVASDRPAQSLWQTQGDFLDAAASDEEFELAVLRYAPFVISQNTPLTLGPSIPAVVLPERFSFWDSPWRFLVAAIPFLLFVVARISSGSARRES
ncbi:CHAT domain-containing protein [Haloferula sp.]|uniref:CHAT domain-containing protein n=1 Tax=Haloferula sp. TaxID=2497595 RepID=UPI003C7476E7